MSMDKRRGFTLIELLIVVVIIGILASIAIPKYTTTRQKAFLSSMKTDLKNLATHQEIYHNSAFTFGGTLALVGATVSDGVTITINEATGSGWAGTASHAGLPGEQCGLYQGNAAAVGGDPGPAEGVVGCTL
jgi:prepilin-type N-terminal cleavage/methylation domain-containing protein